MTPEIIPEVLPVEPPSPTVTAKPLMVEGEPWAEPQEPVDDKGSPNTEEVLEQAAEVPEPTAEADVVAPNADVPPAHGI